MTNKLLTSMFDRPAMVLRRPDPTRKDESVSKFNK